MRQLLAVAVVLMSTSSFAAAYSGTVNQVEVVNGSASWFPLLYIRVNDTASGVVKTTIGQMPTPGTCPVPTATMDTLKIWQSIATSAMLSGKTVTVYYIDCTSYGNPQTYIYSVVLNP